MTIFAVMISALFLSLAFPPYNIFWLAWFSLVPLVLVLIREENNQKAFIAAAIFAVLYFGTTLSWILTINHWYPGGGWLSWIAIILGGTFWILLWAALVLVCRAVLYYSKDPKEKLLFYFCPAILWAFIEWARQFGIFGSTLSWLGYSQWQDLPIAQLARLTGVPGISYLIVLVNTGLALVLKVGFSKFSKKTPDVAVTEPVEVPALIMAPRIEVLIFVLIAIISFLAAYSYGTLKLNSLIQKPPCKLVVLQPNVPQEHKLNNMYYEGLKQKYLTMLAELPFPGSGKPVIYSTANISCSSGKGDLAGCKGINLSRKELTGGEIIFLPETIVPQLLTQDQAFMAELALISSENKVRIVFGSPYYQAGKLYNSAFVVYRDQSVSRYDKVNLVPFGEYLPVPGFLRGLFAKHGYFSNDYEPGTKYQPLQVNGYKLGLGICFESTFPWIYKKFADSGADLLAAISNDAWFLNSAGAEQHLMASTFRAI
ncbi:MAG: apolipoprotein N-acyltransferase, partial [Candidatus Margulisiibacteriota bacterium]